MAENRIFDFGVESSEFANLFSIHKLTSTFGVFIIKKVFLNPPFSPARVDGRELTRVGASSCL